NRFGRFRPTRVQIPPPPPSKPEAASLKGFPAALRPLAGCDVLRTGTSQSLARVVQSTTAAAAAAAAVPPWPGRLLPQPCRAPASAPLFRERADFNSRRPVPRPELPRPAGAATRDRAARLAWAL